MGFSSRCTSILGPFPGPASIDLRAAARAQPVMIAALLWANAAPSTPLVQVLRTFLFQRAFDILVADQGLAAAVLVLHQAYDATCTTTNDSSHTSAAVTNFPEIVFSTDA